MFSKHRRPSEMIVRAGFATEQAVYGMLLVAGMIVAAGAHGGSSVEVLVTVVVTVLVFWAAHVYAGTVAHHGLEEGHNVGLRDAFRTSLRATWGMLLSAIVPCIILLLGTLRVFPDRLAGWLALISCIITLAVLGYVAYQRRGAPLHLRIVGALVTAGFGALLALLKAIIH